MENGEKEIELILESTRKYLVSALAGRKFESAGNYGGFANMPPVIRMLDDNGKTNGGYTLSLKPTSTVTLDA